MLVRLLGNGGGGIILGKMDMDLIHTQDAITKRKDRLLFTQDLNFLKINHMAEI